MIALPLLMYVRSEDVCPTVPGCQCNPITGDKEIYFKYDCKSGGLSFVPIYSNDKTLEIWLGKNMIEILPENAFALCVELEILDLEKNQLRGLPEKIFAKNVNVTRIFLRDNQIESLPENIFSNNVNLFEISLQRNQISSLPTNIFGSNVELRFIYLHGNKIQWLSEHTFANNVKLMNLRITFDCKCLQTSVYTFILELDYAFTDFNCMDTSKQISDHRVVNCTDSSMITLYSSSDDNINCPCENKTTRESSTFTAVKEVAASNSVSTEALNIISVQSTEGVTAKTKISLSAESTEKTNSLIPESTESVSMETQNKLSVESTETLKHLSSKPTDWMSIGTRYLAFSISMGVLAGVVAATVMAVNVLSNKFTQIDIEKISKMEKGDADILLEVVMEDCEIDFGAFEREVIAAQILNIPPICHMYSTNK